MNFHIFAISAKTYKPIRSINPPDAVLGTPAKDISIAPALGPAWGMVWHGRVR